MQRAGRVARGRDSSGLAVLLVERSAYTIDLSVAAQVTINRRKGKGTGKAKGKAQVAQPRKTAAEKTKQKEYATAHGSDRGGLDGHDDPPDGVQPKLDPEAEDEGLLALVQSTTCRRAIWTKMFGTGSVNAVPPGECNAHVDTVLTHLWMQQQRSPAAIFAVLPCWIARARDLHHRLQELKGFQRVKLTNQCVNS